MVGWTLRYHKSGAPLRQRQFIVFDKLGTSETVGAFDNSLSNCMAAIIGRVLFRKVDGSYVHTYKMIPSEDVYRKELMSYSKGLKQFLPEAAPIALESFPGLYSGRKKANYVRALEEFRRVGFKPSHAHIRMFLKYEKDIRSLKPERIPRVISPAGFVYLLLTGVYIKAVEHAIYDAINELYGYFVVAKGINYDRLAEVVTEAWESYVDPAGVDIDVEKLDASISASGLAWTHDILGSCFTGIERKILMDLLKYQLKSTVKGRADDGWFKYKIKGTLTSGQMNTAAVGVLIVTGILYEVCKIFKLKLVNCGDDCSLIGERKDIKRALPYMKSRFRKFGMLITSGEIYTEVETLEFCQMHIMRVDDKWRAVRNVAAILTKDSVCIENLRVTHKVAAWAASVAQGGLANFGGIPVIQNFYRCFLRSYNFYMQQTKLSYRQRKRMKNYIYDKSNERIEWGDPLCYVFNPVTEETRLSFNKAFNITPSNQIALEHYYDELLVNFDVDRFREVVPTFLSLLL